MITIDTKQLTIGMFVSSLDRPWEETPFLFQGFPIENEKQILKLQELCRTVQVDEKQSDESIDFSNIESIACSDVESIELSHAETINLDHAKAIDATNISTLKKTRSLPLVSFFKSLFKKKKPIPTHPLVQNDEKNFIEEMSIAKQIYANTSNSLQKIMNDFRLSKDSSSVEIKSCVHSIINGVVHNPNALALLSSLKSKQKNSVQHSLNVCIISLLFGRYLGFSTEQLMQLGYAALLHDVGEVKIPQAILDKPPRQLSPDEKKLMEKHTEYGAQILLSKPEIPDVAAKVAHSHHERVNGKGYPRGLKGFELDNFSKLVAIVDVYETVTNNPYTTQVSCSDALKSIYSLCDSYFDRKLVEDFIKCLGIYPIGSVVELSSKEIAIVITVKPGKHLLPVVMIVIGSQGTAYYPPKVVNLDSFKNNDGTAQLFIVKVIPPETVGIDLSDYMIREMRLEK